MIFSPFFLRKWQLNTPFFQGLILLLTLVPTQALFGQKANYPTGKIEGPFVWKSTIYPGTERNYWVYVPAQYDANKPSCSMVVQDGLGRAEGWRLPQVLDSLIALKAIPVIIGIFVDHGKVPADAPDQFPRYNRSFEYDGLGDRYARFLLEELLPEVGRSYNLSQDPNDRSIAGASSGAICAFNAAWERPDAFSRVLSTIGTYVGLRGGDEFHTLVRKSEPKPLRVFLEDGNTDLNIYAGDWWMANQTMFSALTWAGYEVDHIWGTEGHNSKGAKKILPQALIWLWQGYPQRVSTHLDQYKGLPLVIPGEEWLAIPIKGAKLDKIAVNEKGDVFFTDLLGKAIYRLDERGHPVLFKQLTFRPGGLSFQQNGELCVANLDKKQILKLDEKGKFRKVITKIAAADLAISAKGIYFTDPSTHRLGVYTYADQTVHEVTLAENPIGLSLSADQTFLQVSTENGVQGYSYKIKQDGTLAFGQTYIHYHVPYGQPTASTQGIAMDTENRSYTATKMGIQVADQLGRINFIFSQPGQQTTELQFGGKAFDTLYTICDGQLYARKINARGLLPWLPAVKPPQPRM